MLKCRKKKKKMKFEVIIGIMVTLLFIGILTLAFDIQPVKASGTIYIRADGSVEPEGTPISSIDNITYTFTGNIYDEIVVERDNIVLDGAGYTLQGTGAYPSRGIDLSDRSNVTIKNMEIKSFSYCIWLNMSSRNVISGNNIIPGGIHLWSSYNNTISGNNITNSEFGIRLRYSSSNNTISGNNITNNYYKGIGIYSSCNNNIISGNNITNSDTCGIEISWASNNIISGNNIANTYAGDGIDIGQSSNNSISGNNITNNNWDGIHLHSSSNNSISGNNITNNSYGIGIGYSSSNSISGNNITNNNWDGIHLHSSSNNSISGNSITENNDYGISLLSSSNNKFYHNNFIGNTQQVYDGSWDYPEHYSPSINIWDNGYPSGGNYWSDHNPPDIYSGPNQDIPGMDGIGDIPYIIDGNNKDRYPLIYPHGYVFSPDVNEDGIVDIEDLTICALAMWSQPGDPNWNPILDLNNDGVIDITDLVMIAIHFGETC